MLCPSLSEIDPTQPCKMRPISNGGTKIEGANERCRFKCFNESARVTLQIHDGTFRERPPRGAPEKQDTKEGGEKADEGRHRSCWSIPLSIDLTSGKQRPSQ